MILYSHFCLIAEVAVIYKGGNRKMEMQEAKSRIAELTEEISKHNYNYYVMDNPEIDDLVAYPLDRVDVVDFLKQSGCEHSDGRDVLQV